MGGKEKTLREGENQGGSRKFFFFDRRWVPGKYCGSSRGGRLENFSPKESSILAAGTLPRLRVEGGVFICARSNNMRYGKLMTMLTHSHWETVPTDGRLGEESESESALFRVVLFSSLRWLVARQTSDLDQNFSPSSPCVCYSGCYSPLGLVGTGGICGYPHRHFDRRHIAPWNWS